MEWNGGLGLIMWAGFLVLSASVNGMGFTKLAYPFGWRPMVIIIGRFSPES